MVTDAVKVARARLAQEARRNQEQREAEEAALQQEAEEKARRSEALAKEAVRRARSRSSDAKSRLERTKRQEELEREEKRRAAFQHRDERLQSFLAKRSSDSRVATLLASGTVTTSALAPPQPGPTSYMEPGPRGPTHTAGATVGRAGPRAPPSGAAGDAGGGSGQTPSHSSGTTNGASGGGGGAVVAPNGAKLDLLKSKRGSAARRPREPASPVL